MKTSSILLFIVFIAFSCKKENSNELIKKTADTIQIVTPVTITPDSLTGTWTIIKYTYYLSLDEGTIRFFGNKYALLGERNSGLNYDADTMAYLLKKNKVLFFGYASLGFPSGGSPESDNVKISNFPNVKFNNADSVYWSVKDSAGLKIFTLKSDTFIIKKQVSPSTTESTTTTNGCVTYNGKQLYAGSKGGCYYINSNGNKTYVDKNYCNCK